MTDDDLAYAWTALDPSAARRRRIDGRVYDWLDAHDTSLAAEWLGLFRLAPFPAAGLVTVSALSMLTAPPVLWAARALL
jgi:hypothetical protein